MNTASAVEVRHNERDQRFEASVPGGTAVACYRRQGDTLLMTHTEVPPALQGQGIAAVVVGAALEHARREGLKVRPQCAYVAVYMRRHPEARDLLAG